MSRWKEITTTEQWEQLYEDTAETPALILKHSTRCPVSTSALEEFEEYIEQSKREDVQFVLVKVIESRPVSNQIEQDTELKHASPQILWIQNKELVWNTSHWSVTRKHIQAVLD